MAECGGISFSFNEDELLELTYSFIRDKLTELQEDVTSPEVREAFGNMIATAEAELAVLAAKNFLK